MAARGLAALGLERDAAATALQRAGTDDAELKALLVWLDEVAFARWKPTERESVVAGALHDPLVTQWLAAMACPHAFDATTSAADRAVLIEWVVQAAVMERAVAESSRAEAMDTDGDTAAAVCALCAALDVPVSEDVGAMTMALCTVLRRCLHRLRALRATAVGTQEYTALTAEEVWSGEPFPLGFDVSDDVVKKVATVLRMLYIGDLRELQWSVNEVIALCQSLSITALTDPKANLSLARGRHGR